MRVTISTHNGAEVRRAHNIRDKRVVEKQVHIDPEGLHETLIDETISHAYHRLFDETVAKYNAIQDRAERRIKNYLAQVEKDAKKHACYEMIIGIYPYKDPKTGIKDPTPDPQIGYEIMRAFVDDWKRRNPNLEIIGAYYHADEIGEQPHVHIDYIPVATGYKKGLEKQSAMRKALEQMGFSKIGKSTAQVIWEARENGHLEMLCKKRGMTVMHIRDGRKHEDTETYKRRKELEKYEQLEVDAKAADIKATAIPMTGKVVVDKDDLERIEEQAKAYVANRQEIADNRSNKKRNAQKEAVLRKKEQELDQREAEVAKREVQTDVRELQRAYVKTRRDLERTIKENESLKACNAEQADHIRLFQTILDTLLFVLAWIIQKLSRIDLDGLDYKDRKAIEDVKEYAQTTLEESTNTPDKYYDRALQSMADDMQKRNNPER